MDMITFARAKSYVDETLVGEGALKGKDGADGKSAYEIAVENGYSGTESEWIASLKGEKGDTGADGAQGEKGDTGEKGEQGEAGTNGIDGKDGTDGYSPTIVENSDNSDDVYKLDITDVNGTFTTPNLKSPDNTWDSGLWDVTPWVNGDTYVKDGYNYCVDFTLEANTTYTMSISEDDEMTMYIDSLDNSVSQLGCVQTFTTGDDGVVSIWLISGRREDDYKNGTILASLVKGTVPIWQGDNVHKISDSWAMKTSSKTEYPYNEFLSLYSPLGKYFYFNTGHYAENYTEAETWSGFTVGNPDDSKATEAGLRLEVPNGGVDFSFLNAHHNLTETLLAFNMGNWGTSTTAAYEFEFNETDVSGYPRFRIEKEAIPVYLTENGLKVKKNNTACLRADESDDDWITIKLTDVQDHLDNTTIHITNDEKEIIETISDTLKKDEDTTIIEFTDETNYENEDDYSYYYVYNGVCYFNLKIKCNSASTSDISVSAMPTPKYGEIFMALFNVSDDNTDYCMIMTVSKDGYLKLRKGTENNSYVGYGSYVIA